jgi:hypothetical protein
MQANATLVLKRRLAIASLTALRLMECSKPDQTPLVIEQFLIPRDLLRTIIAAEPHHAG